MAGLKKEEVQGMIRSLQISIWKNFLILVMSILLLLSAIFILF